MDGYLVSGIQQVGVGVRDLAAGLPLVPPASSAWTSPFSGRGGGGTDAALHGRRSPSRARRCWRSTCRAAAGWRSGSTAGARRWPRSSYRPAGGPGDLRARLKARDVRAGPRPLAGEGAWSCWGRSEPDPAGEPGFFVRDPFGNIFQVVAGDGWFARPARGLADRGGERRDDRRDSAGARPGAVPGHPGLRPAGVRPAGSVPRPGRTAGREAARAAGPAGPHRGRGGGPSANCWAPAAWSWCRPWSASREGSSPAASGGTWVSSTCASTCGAWRH